MPAEEQRLSTILREQQWLRQVEKYIVQHLCRSTLQIGELAEAVNTSERQLFRQIKQLTGVTPGKFILEIRLQMAKTALENQRYTRVKQVARAVGFRDVVYFSRLFRQRFGSSPTTCIPVRLHPIRERPVPVTVPPIRAGMNFDSGSHKDCADGF